jgi:hypothetical protein
MAKSSNYSAFHICNKLVISIKPLLYQLHQKISQDLPDMIQSPIKPSNSKMTIQLVFGAHKEQSF